MRTAADGYNVAMVINVMVQPGRTYIGTLTPRLCTVIIRQEGYVSRVLPLSVCLTAGCLKNCRIILINIFGGLDV